MDNDVYYVYEDEFDKETFRNLMDLCTRYMKRSKGKIFHGRNRNTFLLGNGIVVKIPANLDGFLDNDWEGSISNTNDDIEEIQYARTRLAYYKDIPIVFMEYVEFAGRTEIIEKMGYEPDWVMSVDCGQVGFNSKGKLVAFDYGCK